MQTGLTPLWCFAAACATAIVGVLLLAPVAAGGVRILTGFLGGAALMSGLVLPGRSRVVFLLAAGLALGGWRGLAEVAVRNDRQHFLTAEAPQVLRVEASVLEGWTPTRWGARTTVHLHRVDVGDWRIRMPRRCRMEVRSAGAAKLPPPGTPVKAIADLRGDAAKPFLVVGSNLVLENIGPPSGLAAWRNDLAKSLFTAAGTDVGRIQAAELAAALSLGRRDLLPFHRVDGWRRSGLGHALAVSGLHVGIVAGLLWILALIAGLSPLPARISLLILIPAFVLLAGSSPSAIRAGLMVCLYLGARLLGRTVSPLAAVLTAAAAMMLIQPALVLEAGFQLTVVVTAALIRWAPPLTARLRGPRWLAAGIAIPVVAQIAAAPLIGAHFRTVVPLAAGVNLAVPILLTPAIPLGLTATALAPLFPTGAAVILDLLGVVNDALWWIGGLGRAWSVTAPAIGVLQVAILGLAALIALRYDHIGKIGAGLWALVIIGSALISAVSHPPKNRIDLLPVSDGLAAALCDNDAVFLFDGGRYRTEAAEQLTSRCVRRLDVVFASHDDEDHIGGILAVVNTKRVDNLILPEWLMSREEVVALLRAARHRRTRLIPVARGRLIHRGATSFLTIWPPSPAPPGSDNDRSMIVRADWNGIRMLLTADAGEAVERALVATTSLRSDILVIPHHGSRSSSSGLFLDAVNPRFALIPAAPLNRYNHPHAEVLERLAERSIAYRAPLPGVGCGLKMTRSSFVFSDSD